MIKYWVEQGCENSHPDVTSDRLGLRSLDSRYLSTKETLILTHPVQKRLAKMRNWAILLLFSPLPFLAEGNLKSYCVVDDDDDCDSDWTPFPNMVGDSESYELSSRTFITFVKSFSQQIDN